MNIRVLIVLFFICDLAFSQFAPPVGQTGSDAIKSNSYKIIGWANACSVERGWLNIADTSLGKASFGVESDATGSSNPAVVSLGDGGSAILSFNQTISNKEGIDFAIFENSFDNTFLEFAHVEVSTDGIKYVRFPSICNIQNNTQTDPFGSSDASLVHNLAGKYKAQYGTPFDLEELIDSSNIDIENINFIKIIDVVGSIDSEFATYDSQGNLINDPFPTEFASGGFDLDAVAIIDESIVNSMLESKSYQNQLYPNPISSGRFVNSNVEGVLYDILGNTILKSKNGFSTDKLIKAFIFTKLKYQQLN